VLAFLVNYYVPGGRSVLQVVFLAPLLVAPAMTAIITQAMFSSNGGVVNDLLGAALRHPVIFDWTRSAWALKALIVWMVVWRWTGWHMVIFVAGFQTIPLQTYEAAIVDGARPRQIFRLVTLPLMRPIVMFSLITATVGGLQLFDEVYVLTGGTGGAQHAGMTMAIYLYQAAFQDFRFGLGSAAAYVIFALIMAASLLLSRRANPQGAAA
jgi:ABC-type sugar transport system permease subunit